MLLEKLIISLFALVIFGTVAFITWLSIENEASKQYLADRDRKRRASKRVSMM